MDSHTLKQLEAACDRSGDFASGDKLRQLQDKLTSRTFMIAFCGHFSAGKSTMINTLMGSPVLPSSPIPTSANVITIQTGAARVRVFRQDGTDFDIPVSELEQLREYATDGELVDSIQIHIPSEFLPERVQLMDTPGIDSTDEAHKVATESALHLADLVIYTMDYNHVQSEVNFGFAKTLQERGKAVWLVVNQVDKHNGFELSFADYQTSVRESFAAWGVVPQGIFYTTMREPEHPCNQFLQLKAALQGLFPERDRLLQTSILHSATHVVEEHGKFLTTQNSPVRERLLAELGDSTSDLMQLRTHVAKLRQESEQQQVNPERLRQAMERELQSLIDNATLTPFQTTELAGKYLESRRPGFRMGILFSGSNTEQERANRLQLLHTDFTDKVTANLDWHIKDLLVKLPEKYGVRNEAYANSVYGINVAITAGMLADWVKEGALASHEYMYQYAKDITAEVKGLYRRVAAEFIEQAVNLASAEAEGQNQHLMAELQQAERLLVAAEALASLDNQERDAIQQLLSLLGNVQDADVTSLNQMHADDRNAVNDDRFTRAVVDSRVVPAVVKTPEVPAAAGVNAVAVDSHEVPAPPSAQPAVEGNTVPVAHTANRPSALADIAGKLYNASAEVENIPGMHAISRVLAERAGRLEQNLFTVALFGAFSAGKSSFANALMGDMLLPVSPNPTTAAINKILPPTTERPHGSVQVKVKSAADMAVDIQASLAVFDLRLQTPETASTTADMNAFFTEALRLIAALDAEAIAPNAKPHFSFLKAVQRGLADMQDCLGMELAVDMNTFREYVAQEWKACFVEWIELYHDNPLTTQGITLIDTPGADSINARHTKVAFDYIKNADAVLFVTYYNHAFSNADREFLIQLGRVKDTFELDKMFFLVNAADLAVDTEELADVVLHVRKNLLSYGISSPRIYPVSSQLALLSRLAQKGALPASTENVYRKLLRIADNEPLADARTGLEKAGILNFEREFVAFTIDELTEVAVQSGMAEIRRALAALTEFIASATQGETMRREQVEKLQQSLSEARRQVHAVETESEARAIEKEVEELIYYVQQRLFIRFTEAFNESFSSSVLRDDAGSIRKQLANSLQELLRFLAFDLAQEMRATAVRVEKQVNLSSGRIFARMEEAVNAVLPGCGLQMFEKISYSIPDFSEELQGVETERFAGALSLYKNAKDFFERNTKAVMREAVEQLLKEPVASYLKQGAEILKQSYLQAFEHAIVTLQQRVLTEMDEYAQGISAALEMKVDLAELEHAKEKLELLL